ncbi:hypothetical protein QQF64_010924 [Cirrhinus molitorella]|uniref:Uncharacterized protein n=1 Tax=Cirrhinus molitorella TaxID=172907 RepID=A0ABR3LZD9_9TELE
MPSSHVCCMLCFSRHWDQGRDSSFQQHAKNSLHWKREMTLVYLLNSFEDVVCVTGHKEITWQRSSLWGQKDADDKEKGAFVRIRAHVLLPARTA